MARFEDYRTFKTAVGGRLLQLEIGKVCEQANGQVMVRYGDTVVNVTACASKEPKRTRHTDIKAHRQAYQAAVP